MKATNILITGGAGYLGSYLVNQLLQSEIPIDKLVVYSRDELKQFDLRLKLGPSADSVTFVIGDVRDPERLLEATKGMDVVIHAAAMKQVTVCEENPSECYKTNVSGTENVIRCCQKNGIEKLIFISTDKAVEPVSVYGNSKQAGEKLVLKANSEDLKATVLRFGNLIGSPGSIVDKIRKKEVKQLTIHGPELTRFADSLDNAWMLVLKCLEAHYGGTILIPKLQSIRIVDLVQSTDATIKIKYGGERGFEKVHENLVASGELSRLLAAADCYVIPREVLGSNDALDRYRAFPVDLEEYSSRNRTIPSEKNTENSIRG